MEESDLLSSMHVKPGRHVASEYIVCLHQDTADVVFSLA